ncbi:MAG: TonB-dependent receptor [Pseudomonadota bacterium]
MNKRTAVTNNLLKSALFCMASSIALNGVITGATAAMAQTGVAQGQSAQINLPSGPLADTLVELGDILNVTIVAPNRIVANKTAPALSGVFTPLEALQLALAGSGLIAQTTGDGAILISEEVATVPDRQQRFAETIEDQVVVTGTRIERTAVNSPAPVDIVTAEEIERFGLTDNTEALRFVPALNQSLTLSTFGNSDDDNGELSGPSFGLSALDLRGLGINRTLVLVNGRRHVPGVANSAAVDVASIPAALIDRVEVLTGGGSSIYGADAVSGVVNYILKDDFEGVDVRANGSLPTRGGGEAYFGALTLGSNFADDRGNVVLNVEYNRQTELTFGERDFTRRSSVVVPNSEGSGVDQRFANILASDVRNNLFSANPAFTFNPAGFETVLGVPEGGTTFGGFPLQQVVDADTGEIRPFDFGTILGNPFFAQGGDASGQVFANPRAPSVPDIERYSINTSAHYDLTDAATFFVEAKYVRNRASAVLDRNFEMSYQPIARDNVFLPELVQSQFDSLVAQNLDPQITLSRSWQDPLTSQPADTIRETFRIVSGFEGEISQALNYSVSLNYGRTDSSFVRNSEVVLDRYYAATDAIADPVTGEPVCRSDVEDSGLPEGAFFPAPVTTDIRSFIPGDGSCVPLNVFALPNELDPEAVAFVFQRAEDSATIDQFVFNATITGSSDDYFTLPAGGISYAAGFEYREESGLLVPNGLDLNQLDRFQTTRPPIIDGGFDVVEGFAEISVPILADLPFAEQLTLDASVRVADYSTVGNATSFAFGAVWRPVNDLRFRASFNRAIRAPNIGELLVPQTEFPSFLRAGEDPCDPVGLSQGSDTRRANCELLVADLANFDPDTSETASGSLNLVLGGNPDLTEETADTFTVGFALTPSALPGLAVVADYYDIQIEDAIGTTNFRNIVRFCADAESVDNVFCDAAPRNPVTGQVESVLATPLNSAFLNSRGIDYQISYNFDLDGLMSSNLGDFSAFVGGTYLIEREQELAAGIPESLDRLDGEDGFAKHFLNAGLSWNNGPWSADYGFNFTSSTVFGNQFGFGIEQLEADPFFLDRPNTGSAFVHYIGGAYQIKEGFQVSLRVNNLLDRDPFKLRDDKDNIRPVSALGRAVQIGVQATF